MADLKCPECDVVCDEHDLKAQVAHMNEFHPEVVAKRLEDAREIKIDKNVSWPNDRKVEDE